MRKKITIITLITSLVLFQGVFTLEVFASDSNELERIQKEREAIKNDLSLQEQTINELYNELTALNVEVNRLDELLVEKQARVDEITYDIEKTIEEISKLQAEIEQLKASIDDRFEILKSRAASYQKSGGLVNYIEVLFGSQSFGDFISRLSAVNQIMDSDATLMEQLESDMDLVEAHQLTTLKKLDELNDMHAEQKQELANIAEEKKNQERAQEAVQSKQQELLAYIEELQEEDSQLKSMEDKVKAEIAAAKKEREERERRRLAAIEKEKARKKQAEEQQKDDSKLVQVAKVEQKVSNNNTKSDNSSKKSDKPVEKDNKAESFTVTATAYTGDCKGCSGVTSTGINLKANPDVKVIAVDPSVIPLGSLVHVEGYGYAIAGDTGGAIRGKKIDVFVPTKKEALNWGVRKVKVTIQ